MAETDYAIRSGGNFRSSRYPGFVGGGVNASGNLSVPSAGVDPNAVGGLQESKGGLSQFGAQQMGFDVPTEPTPEFQTPDLGKAAGELALGGGAGWAASTAGRATGEALASGASFGDALSAGGKAVVDKVSGFFSPAASEAGAAAAKPMLGMAGMAPASIGGAALGDVGAGTAVASGGLGFGADAAGSGMAGMSGMAPGGASGGGSGAAGGLSSSMAGSLGAAAGVGLASFGVGLATGQKPGEAALGGLGSGLGYLGGDMLATTALLGTPLAPIAPIIGAVVGGFLCFAAGTPILMADNSWKNVEDIDLDDLVMCGGRVVGKGVAFGSGIYEYLGTHVSGYHAVFEDGKWLRVEDSELGVQKPEKDGIRIYPLVTQNHLLVTPQFIAADFEEVDEGLASFDDTERLDLLNGMKDRNNVLEDICRTFYGRAEPEARAA